MLRMQRREIRARRVHAVLTCRRSPGGLQGSGDEVQGLHGRVWIQDIIMKDVERTEGRASATTELVPSVVSGETS